MTNKFGKRAFQKVRTVGQNFPMPSMVKPGSVYAGPAMCDNPPIPMIPAQQCDPPGQSVQLNKRTYTVTIAEWWILDTGAALQAGFGPAPAGRNAIGTTPADQTLYVRTDAQSQGIIRDITCVVDGYAEDGIDPRIAIPASAGMNYGVFDGTVGRSFTESVSAFLSGAIVIDNQPFATRIPTNAAIKVTGGYRVFYDLGGITTATYIVDQVTLAAVDMFRFQIAPEFSTTHSHAPAPIEIHLQRSAEYQVFLEVPIRTISPVSTAYANYVFIWTGMISITIEKVTTMGTMRAVMGANGQTQLNM